MAMFPALMNNSIFGDFFDDPFFNNWRDGRRQGQGAKNALNSPLMNTDVREKDGQYQLSIDMPGFDKKDIGLRLEDGYLIVSAQKNSDQGDKDDQGRWIRRQPFGRPFCRVNTLLPNFGSINAILTIWRVFRRAV